jgi:hypothetical protein
VDANRALTVFIFDHGVAGKIYLNGVNNFITPENLDTWLSQLEAAKSGLRVNVILEACFAGSFIRAANASDAVAGYNNASFPSALSKPGRVVIASTNAVTRAYASATGANFSDAFIAALDRGESLFTAFQEGRYYAKVSSYNVQAAWLDDNGDGVPNTSSDGAVAQVRGFTYAGTFSGESYSPYIAEAEVKNLVNGQGVIEADVRDDTGVLSVWAVIYPPSYQPPPATSGEMVKEILITVMLLDNDQDGLYNAIYPNFGETGLYRIVIYANDVDTQQGRPLDISVRTGWKVFVPAVMKSSSGQAEARLPVRRGR